MICVALDERTRGGVNTQLGRRELEDQPSAARIDGGKLESVAKEGPIGLGIVAVQQKVYAVDHELTAEG